MSPLLLLVILLVILALVLLWYAGQRQKYLGLPRGRVIYADSRHWKPIEQPFYSAKLGLTGKPDYLVEQHNQLIPVEVKSTHVSQGPYDSHIYQLAAYCLLVKDVFRVRPDFGILHYPNQTYRIDFTDELEAITIGLLQEIRSKEKIKNVQRSHEHPTRCRGCGYYSTCDQRLIKK